MKTFITTLTLITLTLGSTLRASEAGAHNEAQDIFRRLKNMGLEVRAEYQTGYLREGETMTFRTTLSSGIAYTLVAGGDEKALDVDISVYDENGNLVARDSDNSDRAVAHVTPRWSGTFRVVVKMARTAGNGARFVLQTGYEQA